MKARFLIVPCLLAACSATAPGSARTNVGLARTRLDVSKFQPGEERDSIVKQIGEPDVVSDQAQDNGEKCEVYTVDTTGQKTFRRRATPGLGPMVVFGYYYMPPNRWSLDPNHLVVVCYKNEKLIRVIAKPCPSAACANAPSSPSLRAPAASTTGKSTSTSPISPNRSRSDEHRLLTGDRLLHSAVLAASRNGDHLGDHLPKTLRFPAMTNRFLILGSRFSSFPAQATALRSATGVPNQSGAPQAGKMSPSRQRTS